MNQKQLIVGIVGAVVFVNLLGFAVFINRRSTRLQGLSDPGPVQPRVAPALETATLDREQLARARRAAGVAALESGDYDKAQVNFAEAQALIGAAAKVDDLLKITSDLRTRVDIVARPARPAAVPDPTPARPARPVRVAAVEPRPVSRPLEVAEPAASGTGTLLVSTTPRGLLVQVDGTALDLTPMRAAVKVGSHRVTLFDGDRKLYETSVEIREGTASTVLKDLSAEFSAMEVARVEPRPEAPTRPEPRPAAKQLEPARPDPTPAEPIGPEPAPVVAATGGLQVSAPGLYGEVWVNGRSVGFAPVTVEDLKPGAAKIEVRVNGVVKRSTTAVVEAGQVKPLRLVR
jgi:hypothetical protein